MVVQKDVLPEIHDAEGNSELQFYITKMKNIIGLKNVTENTLKALRLLALHPYLIDDVTHKVYRIGIENGTMYNVEVNGGIDDVLNLITSMDNQQDYPTK